MGRQLIRCVIASYALLVCCVSFAQIELAESDSLYNLIGSSRFALSEDANATIKEALSFQYLQYGNDNENTINLGYRQRPAWLRIEFNSAVERADQPWILDLGSKQLAEVSMVHFIDGVEINSVTIDQQTKFNERPIPHASSAFPFPMQAGQHTLYFRLVSNLGLVIAPRLVEQAEFYESVALKDQSVAFFYGALTILLLYNFLVFLSTRDVLFLSHVMIMITMLAWNLSLNGVGFQYLWPDQPELTIVIQRASISLFSAALGVFSFTMFRGIFWPRLIHQINTVGIGANLFIAAFPVFSWAPIIGFIGLSICPAICAYLCFEVVRKRLAEAYYYATAWFIFALAFVVGIFRVFSWLPVNFFTENIALIALLSSLCMLSNGLAGRIKIERIARAAAEASTKSKMEFLANMSHEIRTPMNAVLGFTDLALGAGANEEQRLYLKRIQSSSKSLMNIINDILDYSKVEGGKLELEVQPFSVNELCINVIGLFEHQANTKSLALSFQKGNDLPELVLGDSMRLGQVLINLVGNALKFTHSGSVTLTVDVHSCKNKHCKIGFTVKDTGIGINAEQRVHLFQPFSQADSSTTRNYGGTGLGLSISKQLLDLMGAEISLKSDAGKGAEFSFVLELPIAKTENQLATSSAEIKLPIEPDSPDSTDSPDAQNLWDGARVLLVEDNQVNQLLAQTMLEKGNISVELASNGQEAIQALKTKEFDLVLMDVQMPIMDGYEATSVIRGELKLANLPVIAMTANALESDRERCMQLGMNDFLSKPIDRENLYRTIGKWRATDSSQL